MSKNKTLIIGLGGTGTAVANKLYERIIWRYGSVEKVPEIEFYGIDSHNDTNYNPEFFNDTKRNFLQMSISASEMSALRSDISKYTPVNGMGKWADNKVFNMTNVVEGVGGIRMMGRVCLLLPKHYKEIKKAISDKISNLINLDAGVEGNKVTIYVVGTPAGGTGSGIYTEIGYLLRGLLKEHINKGNEITTLGILLLPNPTKGDEFHMANTYSVLTELNTFSEDGVEYIEKYPDLLEPVKYLDTPYDYSNLVSFQDEANGVNSFGKLKQTVADYIYASASLGTQSQIVGKLVDFITASQVAPNKRGSNEFNYTFGISFIEYPVDRIVRGAKFKLLYHTFDSWLQSKKPVEKNNELKKLGLRDEDVIKRLLSGSNIEQEILNNLRVEVDKCRKPKQIAGLFQMRRSYVQDIKGKYSEELGRQVPEIAESMVDKLYENFKLDLFDINKGPRYCKEVVELLERELTDDSAPGKAKKHRRNTKSETVKILESLNDDLWLHYPLPFWKLELRKNLNKWKGETERRLKNLIRVEAKNKRRDILAAMQPDLQKLSKRLDNYIDYLEKGQAAFDSEWERLDEVLDINGVLLFEKGSHRKNLEESQEKSSITKAFREAFGIEQGRRVALKEKEQVLLNKFKTEQKLVFHSKNLFSREYSGFQSGYEAFKDDDISICQNFAEQEGSFEGIKNKHVRDVFTARFDKDSQTSILETLKRQGSIMLSLNKTNVDFNDSLRRSKEFLFIEGSQSDENRGFIEKVTQVMHLEGDKVFEIDAKNIMIYVTLYGGFPMFIMNSLPAFNNAYRTRINRVDPALGNLTIPEHNRKDIDWEPIEASDLTEARALLIIGLALDAVKLDPMTHNFILDGDKLFLESDKDLGTPNVRLAARKLNDNDKAMVGLRTYLRSETIDGEEELLIERINRYIRPDRFDALGIRGYSEGQIEATINKYFSQDLAYKNAWLSIKQAGRLEGYGHLKKENGALGAGYYCNNTVNQQLCGGFLGKDMVIPRCTRCGKEYP